MTPLESVIIAGVASVAVGGIVWVILNYVNRKLPGYAHVDAKTRQTEQYLERAKQGMK